MANDFLDKLWAEHIGDSATSSDWAKELPESEQKAYDATSGEKYANDYVGNIDKEDARRKKAETDLLNAKKDGIPAMILGDAKEREKTRNEVVETTTLWSDFFDKSMQEVVDTKKNQAMAQFASQGISVVGNEAVDNYLTNDKEFSLNNLDNLKLASMMADAKASDADAEDITNGLKHYDKVIKGHIADFDKQMQSGTIMPSSALQLDEAEKRVKKNDGRYDINDTLAYFHRKDEEGRDYYEFNGKRLYSYPAAHSIVKEFVDEHNYWIDMQNPEFRELWAKKTFGVSFDTYVRREYDKELKPMLEQIRKDANDYLKDKEIKFSGEHYVPTTDDAIVTAVHNFERGAESLLKPTFWNGVREGFVPMLMTAGGITGIEGALALKQTKALDKAMSGEELSKEDKLLVDMFVYEQKLNDMRGKFRPNFDANKFGSGATQSAGYMLNLALEGVVLGGGLIQGAETTIKEAFEEGVKTSIKEGIKNGMKVAGRNFGVGLADDAVRNAINPNTYAAYGERRKGQYSLSEDMLIKEEANPFADVFRAYMDTYAERAGERVGSIVDDGIEVFGRAVAQTNAFGKFAKPFEQFADLAPVKVMKEGLRQARIQGLVGEVASEYATAFMQPILTGDLFTSWSKDGYSAALDKHYSEVLSKDTALSTIAICGAMSGVGTTLQLGAGVYAGVKINSLDNKVKKALEGISDKNDVLRNKVYEAINSNNYSDLAKFNWASVDEVEDVRRATSAIFNSAKVKAIKGELNETERINTFMPILTKTIEGCWRGVDMANPTPTTDVVQLFDAKGGYIGNVIYGDPENAEAMLTIRRPNSDKAITISVNELAQSGFTHKRTSMNNFVAEQYALMFGTGIAKERLDDIISNVRGYNNMSEDAKKKVLEDNGFSVHKVGDIVTLADGRQAVIAGEAYDGYYNVETADANGNKTKLLVGFESILSNDADMAQAQIASQGEVDAPVALPTDKDGNVILNEIDNGKTLAMVLPATFGSKKGAVDAIDKLLASLDAEEQTKTKGEGLDALAEAKKNADKNANRLKVLEDARIRLTGEARKKEKTAEDVASERNAKQAEKDAMSTYEFSRDYRSRAGEDTASAQILMRFATNAGNSAETARVGAENLAEQIAEKEGELSNAFSTATSEADMERITEETKPLQQEIEQLKAEREKHLASEKVFNHRKAQYEQTLKDMGAKKTIGEDAEFKALVEKTSEVLGLPIIVTDKPFANSRQNGMHRVLKDGNAIYINSLSTHTEQSVGILAHEIVHEFKQFLTPEEWAKFEDVIMTARFGKDWANSEAYKKEIEEIQDAERRSGHAQGVGNEKAREEAVAYAIQDYIFNGADGVRAFEAIVNQDLNWRDKLIEALRKVVDKLKSLFNGESKAVQEAIAEFENVFKRYAQKSGEIKAEQIEGETAAIINEKDGQSSFSLSTYEDGGRDILRNFLASQVDSKKLEQKDANAILTEMDAIYDICMDYKDEYAPFGAWSDAAVVRDDEGMPVFSVIKANGDYAMNLDFSLVCKKRRTLDAVLNEMIGRKLIEIAPDDPTFIAKVNDIVRKYGFETACRLCFVDAKRFRVVSTARNFCKLYNGVVAKLMPTDKKVAINSFDAAGVGYPIHEGSLDTLADSELNIKSLEDILKRNGEKTVIAKIARHLLDHPEDRKLVHISDFVSTRGFDPTKALNPQILSLYNSKKGSGGPKASFSDVQYLNDVIYADWNKEDAYAVGGVRVQSFSDYVPRMVFDYMQMVADLAAKQMPVHAYTKETAFAKTFGLTGMKINMSLVPTVVEGGIAAGLDADGNYAWEEGETFDYDTAIEIQNADGYRENCGTIAVGVSDEHIGKMLDDDNIRMVIPYHKSGLNKAVAIANNIDAFKDYTNQQNTRYADGTKLSSADSKNVPNFNEDTRRLGDPRKAADAYLAWCKENNYKPKFDKWASHPNYYKLLEDFTTLVDGEYFEQRGVTMTFPKEGDAFGSLSNLIAESLEEDAVLEGKRDSLVGEMVDEIESTLFSNREKALESSNSLNKLPNQNNEVVGTMDVESYSIDRSPLTETELASLAESEGTASFSLVRDEAKIAELEASPKRIGYRNVILNEDGSFSSPMATHIGNTGKGKVKSATFNLGEWEEAEENPQLVDEKGQVYIYKDNGGSVKVAYDPYIHNRLDKVNAQFKEAWKRPNLVYVETEVPITDLESGYHADKAKLPVGVHSWSNGDLMLSRYDKPIRIVSWEEVADDWVARFKDRGVEFDIVPPALLPILKERGVEILPPHKGLGADATEAYEESRTEQESYSLVRPTNEEVTYDNFYEATSAVFNKVDSAPSRKADYTSRSGSKYWYGEDEGGKYVIRQSDHWSTQATNEEEVEAFNAKPDNYNNIASCYWAIKGEANKSSVIKLDAISKDDVRAVDYNTDSHRLNIILTNGRKVYRDGVAVRDMRKYYNLLKSQGAKQANDYIVDMVNEKYNEVQKPADAVQVGKAYLNDFTKWEVEPRESFSILRDEDTDTIFATAKEEFASTNDWKKTGWLMPDGTQLDFAEGGDYRGTDHRAIGVAYKGTAEHQWQYLQDFENRGGIRIHMNRDGKYGTLEMSVKPTADQKKKLRSFVGAVGGNVDVDFMDENYNTTHSVSYDGVSPARVLSGITTFYDKGIKPKGNVSYSVSREETKLKDGVRAILDEYNNEGMQYRSEIDIANGIEALINDYEGDATELENILNDFRMAQDNARAWGNRMDAGGEEVFMDALNAWVNSKGDVRESYSLNIERKLSRKESRQKIGATKGNTSSSGQPFLKKNPTLPKYGAKLSKNYESAINEIIKLLDAGEHIGGDTFLRLLDIALANRDNISKTGSDYIHLGNGVTLRISNHYAVADNFRANNNPQNNYGVVIKQDGKKRFKKHENVDYLEYVYFPDKMDGGGQKALLDGLKQFIKTGDFKGSLPHPYKINPSGKFAKQGETNYSLNRTDIDYLDAVGRGDMATAQKMVDEAAKKVLKKSKIVDKEGNPILMSHRTNAEGFYTFDREKIGTGQGQAFLGAGFNFARGNSSSEYGSRNIQAYLDVRKPLRSNRSTLSIADIEGIINELNAKSGDNIEYNFGGDVREASRSLREYSDLEVYSSLCMAYYGESRDVLEVFEKRGYDSTIEVGNDKNIRNVVVFNSNQIKSADAITYDNNGNIIPLSERFNLKNDDIRYSINRDEITVATPEMVAEANPSGDATKSRIDAIRNEIEEKINRIATKKNVTFEEIEKLMLDENDDTEDIRKWVREWNRAKRSKDTREQEIGMKVAEDALEQKFGLTIKEAKRKVSETGTFMTAIQKSAKARYNRIIKAVVASLKTSPSKGVMGKDVATWVRRAMTQVYLDMADANLKATQRDVKSIITKPYEKKNSKGETQGKLVDYVGASILNKVQNFVSRYYQRVNDKGETVTDLENPALLWKGVGRPDINTEINTLLMELDELREELGKVHSNEAKAKLEEKIHIAEGVVELLEEFRNVVSIAEDIASTEQTIKDIRTERNEISNAEWRKMYNLKTILQQDEQGKDISSELQKLGFANIADAKKAVHNYEEKLESLKDEMFANKRQLSSEKLALLDALKDFNTAVYGIESVGRIAFKEEKEQRKQQMAEWRVGILRSVRNPLFANTIDYDEVEKRVKNANGKKYSALDNAKLRSRGDSFLSEMADTFEFEARKMDVMSIPNAWLHSGYYYQFILHPENGVMARSDWRYHTEKQVRGMLDLRVKEMLGFKNVDKLSNILNKSLGITYNVALTNSDGEVKAGADVSSHEFTVDEALYIRAVTRQDGVMGGYYTVGLSQEQIDNIIAEVERKYPRLCEVADWVQGEDGIFEYLYQMNNEVYRAKNGRDLEHTPQYMPIRRKADTVPTESNLGDTISVSRLANGIGSNKKRVRNKIAMDVNARFFGVVNDHIRDVVQWVAYADLFDKMNTLLSSPMFRKMLQVQGVKKTTLENCFLRAAGERLGESESSKAVKAVNTLARNAVASNVVGNLNSALKQLVSITAGLSTNVSPEIYFHFVKNFPLITNITTIVEKGWRRLKNDDIHEQMDVVRSNYTWALYNIPTFAERVDSGSMGMDIFQRDSFETWGKVADFCKKYGMAANKFMDCIVSASVAKTVYEMEYKKLRKRGLTHEQAHDDARFMASVLVNQTQQSDQGAFLSGMQSDRKGLASSMLSATLTAYNNSQLAFDRNARSATLNLLSLCTDGGNKRRVALLASEYESRGLSASEAVNLAKRDLFSAFLIQAKILLHNTTINPMVWAYTPLAISWLTMSIATFAGGDDDDNESLDAVLEKHINEFAEKVLERGWVYLLPTSNIIGMKDVADKFFDKGKEIKPADLLGGKSSVILQPLAKSMQTIAKYLEQKADSQGLFGSTNADSQITTFGCILALVDIFTRYGLGVSSKTALRMSEGLYDAIRRGNVEDFMNATTQSGVLTKAYASALRKDEMNNPKMYIERRAGAEKVVDGYSRGVDMRKFEREYADKMDEYMFLNTDFDFEKFKEDKKFVNSKAKAFSITGNYRRKEDVEAPSKEVQWLEIWAMARKSVANSLTGVLKKIQNWDEDNIAKRKELYRKAQDNYGAFIDIYNSPDMETAMKLVEEHSYKSFVDELKAEYVDHRGRPTRNEKQIEREARAKVEELMQERSKYLKGNEQ